MARVVLDGETRRSGVGGAIYAVSTIALIAYLTYAALQGEHGLFRLIQIEAQERKLAGELAALRAERETVENLARRLSTESLDLELLDERARRVLGLGRADEILIR